MLVASIDFEPDELFLPGDPLYASHVWLYLLSSHNISRRAYRMSFCFVFDISVWIISFSMLFLPLWLICHMQANVWIKFVRSLFMLLLGIVLSIFPILLYWVTGFEDSCFWFLFVFSDNSSSYCNNKYLILFTLHHLHFLDCIDDIPTDHWPSYCVNYGLE